MNNKTKIRENKKPSDNRTSRDKTNELFTKQIVFRFNIKKILNK